MQELRVTELDRHWDWINRSTETHYQSSQAESIIHWSTFCSFSRESGDLQPQKWMEVLIGGKQCKTNQSNPIFRSDCKYWYLCKKKKKLYSAFVFVLVYFKMIKVTLQGENCLLKNSQVLATFCFRECGKNQLSYAFHHLQKIWMQQNLLWTLKVYSLY